MTLIAAIGQAQVTDAREAGMQAAYQALNGVGTVSPAFGLLIVPHRYDPQQVINGAASILTNTPLIGFSVSTGISNASAHSHAVVIALLAGDSLQAETHWLPSFSQSSAEAALRIAQLIGYEQRPAEYVLAFAEGFRPGSNTDEFCANLPAGLQVFGGLASGDMLSDNSFQIAGMQSGTGSLAAAFLRGNIKVGIGYGHGWHAVGSHVCITRSDGFWLRGLDGKPASEIYSQLFGQTSHNWTMQPLNTISRIYPLGFEQAATDELLIRAPIRMDADGSLRMNSTIPEGSEARLMVASPTDCVQAAHLAAKQALSNLGDAKPVFALVLVDPAWQTILQAWPGKEIQIIQSVLGSSVPIAGGYTHGQIVPPSENNGRARLLNQHILVAIFGEKETQK